MIFIVIIAYTCSFPVINTPTLLGLHVIYIIQTVNSMVGLMCVMNLTHLRLLPSRPVCSGYIIRYEPWVRSMYDTLYDVWYIDRLYPPLTIYLVSIVLLLAAIFVECDCEGLLDLFLLWHATGSTGKLPGGLYIIIAVKICFACPHMNSMCAF